MSKTACLSDFTFVIPTLNGAHRLMFLCQWLGHCNFSGTCIVIDATLLSQADKFEEYAFIEYLHLPQADTIKALAYGMQRVNTNFSAFLGDDDLPLLKSYEKCVSVLLSQQHLDSCYGHASFINFDELLYLETGGIFRKFWFCARTFIAPRYDRPVALDNCDAKMRVRNLADQYIVTQFFVTRTKVLKTLYNEPISTIRDTHLSEYAICYAHAALARSKYIPNLYMLRGIGNHRPNSRRDERRHILEQTGYVEKKLKDFVKLLPIDPIQSELVYRLALGNRYRNENKRVLQDTPKQHPLACFGDQFRRLCFVLGFQSGERVKLVRWILIRGKFLSSHLGTKRC